MTSQMTNPVEATRERTSTELARLLADTYATYQKTLYYHWNVTGSHFHSLHLMFEEQYQELQLAIDVLAERMRQLGTTTPAFGQPTTSLTNVPGDTDVPTAMDMVNAPVDAHEITVRTARSVVETAEDRGDVGTADIATERIEAHRRPSGCCEPPPLDARFLISSTVPAGVPIGQARRLQALGCTSIS